MATSPSAPALCGFEPAPLAVPLAPRQQTLDELGESLSQVTFVVLDVETTGASPNDCAITEIGALRLRGGVLLGQIDTLVNPGVPIPPTITMLTGITEAMVMPAPRIEQVLPALLELLHGAVVVGHNVRFDCAFIDAALAAHGYPRLTNRRVDTIGLARRLVRDEVPNLRLQTLAAHFRTSVEPVHRAYADAAATAEVFHTLLERAATFGVLGLDDLLALPSMRAHPSAAKLALTASLPRKPGVYLFRDRDGRVLYVGKAANLRARVRSYFSGDDRRKVPQLLRETARIDHRVCAGPLEAAVRELRLIQRLQPRFNRQAKAWRQYAYLRLTDERFPRLTVTRRAPAGAACALGPFRSSAAAHVVREAIETAVPLRRCPLRIGRRAELAPGPACVPAQLGVATCPCRAHVDDAAYGELVDTVRRGLTTDPALLVEPLASRMRRLAETERFEEAAATRDRLAALTRALHQRNTVVMLRRAHRIVLDSPEGRIELRNGRLVLDGAEPTLDAPIDDREDADLLATVARWLRDNAGRVRVVHVDGELASPLPRVPTYEAGRTGSRTSVRS